MITKETMALIERILAGDQNITSQEKENVLKACRQKARKTLISAKQAMAQLQISRPTLRAYVNQGLLHQVNFSSRKVRFDLEEVMNFASGDMAENEEEE